MKNHAAWSEMVLSSITLENKTDGTGVDNVCHNNNAKKCIKNGQMYIIRDNVQYNILGAQAK